MCVHQLDHSQSFETIGDCISIEYSLSQQKLSVPTCKVLIIAVSDLSRTLDTNVT